MSEIDQQGPVVGQSRTAPIPEIKDIKVPQADRLELLVADIVKDEAQLMANFIIDDAQFGDMDAQAQQSAIERYTQFLQVKVQIQHLIDMIDIDALEQEYKSTIEVFSKDTQHAQHILKEAESRESSTERWQVLSEYFSDYEAIGHILQHSADLAGIVEEIAKHSLKQIEQAQPAEDELQVEKIPHVQKVEHPPVSHDERTQWVLSIAKANPWFEHIVKHGSDGETLARATKTPKALVVNNVNNVLRAAERSGHFPELGNQHRSKKLIALRATLVEIFQPQETGKNTQPTPVTPLLPVIVSKQEPAKPKEGVHPARPALVITQGELSDDVLKQFFLSPEHGCRVGIDDDYFEKQQTTVDLYELSCAIAIMNGLPLEEAMSKNGIHSTPIEFIKNIAQLFGVSLSSYEDKPMKTDIGILIGAGLRVRIFGSQHDHALELVSGLRNEFSKHERRQNYEGLNGSFFGSGPKKSMKGEKEIPLHRQSVKRTFDPELQEEIRRSKREPKNSI